MRPTLLILAAGIGSRYGGLKQIDPVGPAGEVIMDYSIYDALQAGFGRVVFVIRHDFEAQFKAQIGARYAARADVAYAFQELTDLPEGFRVPEGRMKPWGTAHAILAARDIIHEPFVMINADDFYGREAYAVIAEALRGAPPDGTDWCMVGYKIGKTLSEYGGVTRAMCELDGEYLTHIVERFEIRREGDCVVAQDKAGGRYVYALDAPTSMNFFGFTPRLFELLDEGFRNFLAHSGQDVKAEYLIPTAVNELVAARRARMRVLTCNATWFGVTYPEDKARVQASIQELVARGEYPSPLWS
ncbi:MAG: sugar phosphate nucleotidyltransferase [bacterium]|nr:sugar phosphate nucleotidyltransferase [bacterium]